MNSFKQKYKQKRCSVKVMHKSTLTYYCKQLNILIHHDNSSTVQYKHSTMKNSTVRSCKGHKPGIMNLFSLLFPFRRSLTAVFHLNT